MRWVKLLRWKNQRVKPSAEPTEFLSPLHRQQAVLVCLNGQQLKATGWWRCATSRSIGIEFAIWTQALCSVPLFSCSVEKKLPLRWLLSVTAKSGYNFSHLPSCTAAVGWEEHRLWWSVFICTLTVNLSDRSCVWCVGFLASVMADQRPLHCLLSTICRIISEKFWCVCIESLIVVQNAFTLF